MIIVKVTWSDWNGEEHENIITSEDYCFVGSDERIIFCAIRYIKRRYTECFYINSVEVVSR